MRDISEAVAATAYKKFINYAFNSLSGDALVTIINNGISEK